MYARIAGTGSYLPEKILTNAELEKLVDTSDEWIRTRTGIEQRHVAAEGETTTDLAEHASRRAMQDAGVTAADIDLICVGTTTPGYLLTVNGPVRASQFIADVGTYSDFVFKAGYRLAPLPEVAASIARDGHLPDIPGAAEAIQRGLDVMAMQAKLLAKIEELTLYAIEQNRRLDAQTTAVQELRQENVAVRATASGPR